MITKINEYKEMKINEKNMTYMGKDIVKKIMANLTCIHDKEVRAEIEESIKQNLFPIMKKEIDIL